MKPYQKDYQIDLLLRQLYDEDQKIRINAINQPGEELDTALKKNGLYSSISFKKAII